jgi:hypothetical protein
MLAGTFSRNGRGRRCLPLLGRPCLLLAQKARLLPRAAFKILLARARLVSCRCPRL